MLHRGKAVAALEAKAERFVGFETDLRDALADYERSLDRLASMTREEIDTALAGMDAPGARPTAEHDMCPRVDALWGPLGGPEEARAWALVCSEGAYCSGRRSQITPSKDFSMPVGPCRWAGS